MGQLEQAFNQDANDDGAVAIIGMTGRFPGANDLATFWSNLRNGVESVAVLSDAELLQAGVPAALIANPDYVKAAALVAGFDLFDADFFGMPPREAEIMDPQQRMFLECCWEVLEHAGYAPGTQTGAVGIFAGTALSAYLMENLFSNPQLIQTMGSRQLMLSNEKDFLCGRAAFELNLQGPAVVVQTACSTSLVAVHMACQSVLNGECDIALAGGVAVHTFEKRGYLHTEGGVFSSDGHCRAFDADANGIITGNGLGLIVLKRLDAARADGDTIHAVIRGSAINNDGADKISFTAPSIDGQAAVISEAQAVAGVSADSIGYIEAHGTGTHLGDPIEVAALTQAFGATTERRQYCAIGSLKTNVGHLDVAAGVAGLIKATLAVKHGEIPPSLHCATPNPHIDFANSPFFVNTTLRAWGEAGTPRRAGVSAFGLGGTNAHVVLEQAPVVDARADAPVRAAQVLLLSAKTPAALDQAGANLARFLEEQPDTDLTDAAYTLLQGRCRFRYRRAVAAASTSEAVAALRQAASTPALALSADATQPALVFMFSGGGTQYVDMGRTLYASEPVFRAAVDECAAILEAILGRDLRTVMFASDAVEAAALLDRVEWSLPALFTIEYAVTRQLAAWGVTPSAMIGHSLGEYVAACLAGVFSLADALAVVAARARLIGSLPSANMLAVLMSPEQVQQRLGEDLWLACVNGSQACTISGTASATEQLAAQLAADDIDYQLLAGWPGSHSGLMRPILAEFRAVVASVRLNAPTIPYLSNLSGDWISAEQATSPDYWVAHLHNTVQFGACLNRLLANPNHVFVEIGPGHTLANLLRREASAAATVHPVVTITTLPRRDAADTANNVLLGALGQLWANGAAIDWACVHGGSRGRRIALPTYAFQRKRYWIAAQQRYMDTPDVTAPASTQDTPVEQGADVRSAQLSTHQRPDLASAYVAAQSPIEQALCAIWENLLGIAPVGIHDHFFQLGGSSLVAVQLASRIRSSMKVELALRTLFDTPTVAAQAIEIARRLQAAAPHDASGPALDAITPRACGSVTPASHPQQRLWFLDQLDRAASAAYHVPSALRLNGKLDKAALRAALDRIVARHESLRTTFASVDGQTLQVIGAADAGFALAERDLSAMVGHERDFAVQGASAAEAAHPFDLVDGPLVRGQLLRLSHDEHVLLITQHHIISDGWSLGNLVREVSTLYAAFSAGLPDPLAPLAIQYADYALWQQARLQGAPLQAQCDFWKARLGGAPALLALPTDRPRPARQSYAGASVALALGPELTAAVKALGQRHGATLFMTLLTGWSALLARLSGQDDVVIGTPVANRPSGQLENLIGFFVNTLALRVRLSGAPTVAQLLAQVKADTIDAYAHQDLPFEQVVEVLQPERSTSHSPVFQVMLTIHNTPGHSVLEMPGLTLSPIEQTQDSAQCDLTLSLTDTGDDCIGTLRYASDLYDEATAQRMVGHFTTLLRAMVSDEHQPVRQLDLLSADQRRQLLVDFNADARGVPPSVLVHQTFEAQAEARPQALALVHGDDQLSYAQLNRQANQLAHRLRALGVQPDDRVALCVERGVSMVVALLAVLKAGAAYVPLDPSYPAERLAYMLADSAPAVLLTQTALVHLAAVDLPRIVLDDAADMLTCAQADGNPDAVGLSAEHLAYVIYTSGSTGTPKGVMNRHAGLANLAQAQSAAFAVGTGSRVLQFASFSFDASISEIVMTLATGASLFLADANAMLPGEPLLATVRDHAITHLTLPSSALAVCGDPAALAPMTLIVAGDACPPELARRWSAHHALFNAYGPTEASVCATIHRCDGTAAYSVPIGKPMRNVQIYILDQAMQPVPLGVAGQICIGGAGVARGYLHRAELTAQRFVADPFSEAPGARLYLTGDQGRWLADGNIEFMGRDDFQVKIRGFRIEPGEVEARLAACEGVREALVVAREEGGDKRLVAYLTLHSGVSTSTSTITSTSTSTSAITSTSPSAAGLRAALAVHLADYMIPSAFVMLDAFPLTPNGKVDRKALPAPDRAAVISAAYAAPEGMVEQALATIWQELLKLEQVGRHDHFFELGGTSLLATQCVARLRDAVGVSLPLMHVFQTPVLSALAEALVQSELERLQPSGEVLDLASLSEEELESLLAAESGALA